MDMHKGHKLHLQLIHLKNSFLLTFPLFLTLQLSQIILDVFTFWLSSNSSSEILSTLCPLQH